MADETSRESMEKRLSKLQKLLEGIRLPQDATAEAVFNEFVGICYVSDAINKELHTHSGTYAFMAVQRAELKTAVEKANYALGRCEQRLKDLCESIVSLVRAGSDKLTEQMKGEVLGLIRVGELSNSSIYSKLVFDDVAVIHSLNAQYAEARNLIDSIEKQNLNILDLKSRYEIIDELVDALGYQKMPCLKALVEREASGLAQQIS